MQEEVRQAHLHKLQEAEKVQEAAFLREQAQLEMVQKLKEAQKVQEAAFQRHQIQRDEDAQKLQSLELERKLSPPVAGLYLKGINKTWSWSSDLQNKETSSSSSSSSAAADSKQSCSGGLLFACRATRRVWLGGRRAGAVRGRGQQPPAHLARARQQQRARGFQDPLGEHGQRDQASRDRHRDQQAIVPGRVAPKIIEGNQEDSCALSS